jgi:hypothetical protein
LFDASRWDVIGEDWWHVYKAEISVSQASSRQRTIVDGQGAQLMCLFFDEHGSWHMVPETVIAWHLEGDAPLPVTPRSVWQRATVVGIQESEFIVDLTSGEYYRNHQDWVDAVLPGFLGKTN